MAILGVNPGDGITRTSPWFDPLTDWTVAGWAKVPTVTTYRTIWTWGDPDFGNGYIGFFGDSVVGQRITFELYDGVSVILDDFLPFTPDAWMFIAGRYTAATHAIDFRIDSTDATPAVFDTSLATYVERLEYVLTDVLPPLGGVSIALWGLWQRRLSNTELLAQAEALIPVSIVDLLAFTPLSTPADLADTSGNGRGWTALGTLTFTGDPIGVEECELLFGCESPAGNPQSCLNPDSGFPTTDECCP